MDDLIKLVRTYRVTAGLAERLRLAEAIFRLIAPDLRAFVFSAIVPQAAEDVSQEVLISIAASLKKFEGNSNGQFWEWCYMIARRRIYDHIQKRDRDRLLPMPHDEILDLLDASAQVAPLTAADRHDLEYALNLLDSSKPECRGYLWNHYVIGFDYGEIAEEQNLNYDNVRMKIGRCLEEAKSLVS
ncbi:MAG TPA: RNA polymerase sigma factor [Verrucomicrobiae bacterium]|jgi:RNA polymerase sigma factor (sigma-70 family)|nr:RNA polymerase sigma factor [Verrucomicrobiae bacterium]